MIKQFLAISSFLFCTCNVIAQQDSMAYYLNDHGLSNFRNIVKVDFSQLLQGNALFAWEHDVTGKFRMEYGIGLSTGSFVKPILNAIYNQGTVLNYKEKTLSTMKTGICFYLSPRFVDIKFPNYYYSINSLVKYYFEHLIIVEGSFTFGKTYNITNRIIMDCQVGIGLDYHS